MRDMLFFVRSDLLGDLLLDWGYCFYLFIYFSYSFSDVDCLFSCLGRLNKMHNLFTVSPDKCCSTLCAVLRSR